MAGGLAAAVLFSGKRSVVRCAIAGLVLGSVLQVKLTAGRAGFRLFRGSVKGGGGRCSVCKARVGDFVEAGTSGRPRNDLTPTGAARTELAFHADIKVILELAVVSRKWRWTWTYGFNDSEKVKQWKRYEVAFVDSQRVEKVVRWLSFRRSVEKLPLRILWHFSPSISPRFETKNGGLSNSR